VTFDILKQLNPAVQFELRLLPVSEEQLLQLADQIEVFGDACRQA
jgi:hypothetical protein